MQLLLAKLNISLWLCAVVYPVPQHWGKSETLLTYRYETSPGLVLFDTPFPTEPAHPLCLTFSQLYCGHWFLCLYAQCLPEECTRIRAPLSIPLNLWPWLIVTCEQHCGKHVAQVPRSPASCLCSASMEGRGGGKEERELFNPPQRNSPLNPYRELAGKSRCWKAHHTHTAVFLISSAERNLYSALESDWAAERSELYSTLECKQVSHQV